MRDKEQVEKLFRQHYPGMYRLAVMLLKDEAMAKDAVSEVFTGILDGTILPRREGTEGFLLVCVRNRCLNLLSHQKVVDRVHRLLSIETEPSAIPVEKEMDKLDQILAFMQSEMTEQTCRVMTLHYEQKMTYREIAQRLSISETAVYKHLSQGIRKLKERFNP
ncbi:MAG: sigma-70 family RNA polymerase sigma factor [Prevotella sp.]|nr:sigma-70 family RNA polymerase sigma factor [Prevotella sp.]